MSGFTVDIALCLPTALHERAIAVGDLLADRMEQAGRPSVFRLGRPFPADHHGFRDSGVCTPHVSLFMLRVDAGDVDSLTAAMAGLAARFGPVEAVGEQWKHNPQGAPELHLRTSAAWIELQQAVVAVIEPIRAGRLRDTDPSGAVLTELIDRLHRHDPDGDRLRQLERYGYDEITDARAARFSPHLTLAWPSTEFAVPLHDLPPPPSWRGMLDDLAAFGMSPNGTCTDLLGSALLTGSPVPARCPANIGGKIA